MSQPCRETAAPRWVLACVALSAWGCSASAPGGTDTTDAGTITDVRPVTAHLDAGRSTVRDAGRGVIDGGRAVIDGGRADTGVSTPGAYCAPCTLSADCAGGACLTDIATETRYCGWDCTSGPCPPGSICTVMGTADGPLRQCAPESGPCVAVPGWHPPHDAGTADTGVVEIVTDAGTAGGPGDDLQHCVDELNRYRAMVGVAAVTRSSALGTFAAAGAMSDSMTGTAHGHFRATSGGGIAFGEDEIPGWPTATYGSVQAIIDQGFAQMWAEGPGGAHYVNMSNPMYTEAGCGFFTTPEGGLWVTQDFR